MSLQFCVPQNGKHSYEQVNWIACVCLQQGLFIWTQTLSTPGLDKVLEEILLSVREERWNSDALDHHQGYGRCPGPVPDAV